MTHHIPLLTRFYSLDLLRGVAALSVVLWHWNFFFLPTNKHGVIIHVDNQPLFEIFYIFYKHGHTAVQLFFCISGFIFFWLYSKRIADRAISLKSFSALRLSRLYPLHFATLILVAVGQLVYIKTTNSSFAFPFNDTYHFLLNLFFASSWGMEKGLSFNGPVWSVSVEVLLYAMFFVFCRIFNRNMAALIAAVILGYFTQRFNSAIGSGVMYFFIGGLVLIAYEKIITTGDAWKVSIWLPWITAIAWLVVISATHPNYGFVFSEVPLIIHKTLNHTIAALFPMTIMSLALIETQRGSLGKRFSFVGDISYSSYLLHFPLISGPELWLQECIPASKWFCLKRAYSLPPSFSPRFLGLAEICRVAGSWSAGRRPILRVRDRA